MSDLFVPPRIWYPEAVGGWPDRGIPADPSSISGALDRKQQCEAIPSGADTGGAGLSDIVFDPTNIEEMEQRLEELRVRHRELDDTIAQLKLDGGHDIRVMGLKREKLRIKDSIAWLSSKLTPDIIA